MLALFGYPVANGHMGECLLENQYVPAMELLGWDATPLAKPLSTRPARNGYLALIRAGDGKGEGDEEEEWHQTSVTPFLVQVEWRLEQLGREDSVSKSVSVTIGMHSILSFSITGSPAFNGYEIC